VVVLTSVHTIRGNGGWTGACGVGSKPGDRQTAVLALRCLAGDGLAIAVDGAEVLHLGLPAPCLYWKGGATRDIGLQCSQPHHGSEHGQRRAMQSSQLRVTIALAQRCRTAPLQVLVLKMMPVFALIEPRADEHATQGANTGRDLLCGGCTSIKEKKSTTSYEKQRPVSAE